ncbi:MAG: DegT/DnrJ/EryC1/StrS family aminotransferase [Candidatus Stahlbacteria bacterium]|nr:DegT/DnrJ/EryC1/StrS family aminotransferase [Candidatus Stahlbacteria bacterium]
MKVPGVQIYFPEEDKKWILDKINESLSTGQLTLGKYVKQFEQEFASYIGTKYAVAVSSGTSAIEIAMRIFFANPDLSGEVKGKEVIVPTNTFFATPAAVLHAGGIVKFVDTERETFAINVDGLKEAITPNTAGVIVVHIGGIISPNIYEIKEICKERGLFLFEDGAHSHGSALDNIKAGAFGDAGSFSFFPTKVITSGEGGMIVTNSETIRDEALIYRDQGKMDPAANLHGRLGYNWRLSEPHAIIGVTQLRRLDEFIEARNRIAKIYDKGLEGIRGISVVKVPENSVCNYYKYIAMLEPGIKRSELKKELRAEFEVGLTGEVYELPCHIQPIFKSLCGCKGGSPHSDFPIAEDVCSRHICLPIFVKMTDEQAEYVVDSISKVISSKD